MKAHLATCACAIAVLTALLCGVSIARGEHAAGPRLLPANTLLYAHVASVPELIDAAKETNIGRLIADPQIQPFLSSLYDAVNEALARFREQTDMSLEEIARIPQGEITIGLIPIDATESSPASMSLVAIVDCGESSASAHKFIDALATMVESNSGRPARAETVGAATLQVFDSFPRNGRQTALWKNDTSVGVVTAADPMPVARQLVDHWSEGVKDCLADNMQFTTVMERCRGGKDAAPQVTFYADPISLVWQLAGRNPAGQFMMGYLPALGLNGLKAVGGSLALGDQDFDSISQLHVVLDNPRTGVLDLIALDSGDDVPPGWVPDDVSSYMSLHWDLQRTFQGGTQLVDNFHFLQDTKAADLVNQRVQATIGLDIEHDILPAVTGRMIHLSWFERPAVVGRGGATCAAIQLKDAKAFRATMDRLVEHFGSRIEEKTVSGAKYYQQVANRATDDPRPQPCFALLSNWMLIGDRPGFMEHLLKGRDAMDHRLADALDYKLIAGKISRQPGGDKPGFLTFSRAEDSWKYMYELASSDSTRDLLRQRSDRNPMFKILNQGLQNSPLPPWEAVARYLAPSGAMLTDDDSGLHYMSFSLRRKAGD